MAALRLIGALLFLCSGVLSALADKFVEIDGREEFAENIKESQQVWAVVWTCSRCKRVGDPAFPNLKERCDAFASTWAALPAHVNVSLNWATLDVDHFQLQAVSQQKVRVRVAAARGAAALPVAPPSPPRAPAPQPRALAPPHDEPLRRAPHHHASH